MGNVSSHGTLLPISLASTIIGFISFAFTLATFFRVFWANLSTLSHADSESKSILSTLRTELDEERLSLRELKRHQRARGPNHADLVDGPKLDYAALENLQVALRRVARRFDEIERPFLVSDAELDERRAVRRDELRQRRRTRSRRRGRGRTTSDAEKVYLSDDEGEEDVLYVEDLYSTVTLVQRWTWLQTRGEAVKLLDSVNRLQTRRIARQVGEIACVLHGYRASIDEVRHGVAVAEDRLSRVVGLRRID
ncbi:hypothetical protein ANO11243_011080 [Dothideomycetidae sp. 11243]|nr:hypothetical protein ANO11243_011080 [fungal sp. No.11243]